MKRTRQSGLKDTAACASTRNSGVWYIADAVLYLTSESRTSRRKQKSIETKAVPVLHSRGVREGTNVDERFQWCPIPLGKMVPRCLVSSFMGQLFHFMLEKDSL